MINSLCEPQRTTFSREVRKKMETLAEQGFDALGRVDVEQGGLTALSVRFAKFGP